MSILHSPVLINPNLKQYIFIKSMLHVLPSAKAFNTLPSYFVITQCTKRLPNKPLPLYFWYKISKNQVPQIFNKLIKKPVYKSSRNIHESPFGLKVFFFCRLKKLEWSFNQERIRVISMFHFHSKLFENKD